MTATFALTAADFLRLQKVVARRFRSKVNVFSALFLFRVLVWLSIGFAGAIYARVLRENPEISEQLAGIAVGFIVAILVTVAMPYLSQVFMRKHMLSPKGAFLSPQSVRLTASSFLVTSAVAITEVPLSGILAREEDDVNYYLFIDSMQALILPRSAVESFLSEFEQRTAHLKNVA